MMLDLESVRLFALVAEYGNLTRAAEAAGTVQPVVSQRIKALETALGRKLLDRSPRFVRLTDAGVAFLERARTLLAAHDAAVVPIDAVPSHVTIGISDHALGTRFDLILKRVRSALPADATITVHLGQSAQVREHYEAGAVDLAIIRREGGADDGEVLGQDPLEWRVPDGWRHNGPLPLVLLPPPCAVRAVAIRTLERGGIPWRETFVGGSCLALVAAVRAGLGVAPLGAIVGGNLPVSAATSSLPALPSSQIVMLARTSDPVTSSAARALAASIREMLR
jgi:DNA-binding transcriptional LysR family regulator